MAYKNKIDSFDPERGDVVSMPREDIARLYACGVEICGPILWTFFGYVLAEPNTPIPTMPDPRDNAILKGLIEHQRRNAHEHFDKLQKSREAGLASAAKRAERRSTAVDHGQQVREEEYKPKNSVSVDSSALYGDASVTPSGGDSTPSASPPTAVIGSGISKQDIIDARATLARYAPEPRFILTFDPTSSYETKDLYGDCAKCCDAKQRQKCKEAGAKGKRGDPECGNLGDEAFVDKRAIEAKYAMTHEMDAKGTYRTKSRYKDDKDGSTFRGDYDTWSYQNMNMNWGEWLFDDMGEPYSSQTCDVLNNYSDTLGETFIRAIWTFHIQRNAGQLPDKDKDGNATNYGKLLFGRLKKLVEAKAILAQVDEARQRPMPPPPTPPRSAQ